MDAPNDPSRNAAAARPASASARPPAATGSIRIWRTRALPIALVAIGLVGAVYGGPRLLLGPAVEVDTARRTDFVMTVVASGHVETPFRVAIGSQIVGIVTEVPVAEGQAVRAGDALVVLDDREVRAALVQAEGAVAQAESRLRQQIEVILPAAEETLRQTRATLANAQSGHDRTARLASDGFATRAALDEATKALDIARAQVRSAELQVFANRPGGSDHVMVETQLRQATANLAAAQSRLSYTVIRAPRDGVLITRDVERGTVVGPSMVLFRLSPTGDTQLVVQIDEKNLGLIAPGQKAIASADAYPRDRFPAELVYINPGIDLQRASVEVKLRVPEPPATLRQDMTVSVDIEVATRPRALVLPAASVRGVAAGRPWVLKVVDGRARRHPIRVGLVGAGQAEILDGVAEGDLVVPIAASGIVDGTRLRARAATPEPP